MIPGVFLFRTTSGLAQLAQAGTAPPGLVTASLLDAATAGTIILAMILGLVIPKLVIDGIWDRLADGATRRAG
jgi:hypothetical protein